MGSFDIRFFTSAFNKSNDVNSTDTTNEKEYVTSTFGTEAPKEVSSEALLEEGIDTNEVFGASFSKPVESNSPVYSDEDLAFMFEEAGVSQTEAKVAESTLTAINVMEEAGFNLAELDEIFEDEPEVVAQTLTAFNNGSATRISNGGQTYSSIIESLPKDAPEGFFDAFMYAINNKEV